ncbi:MAG: type II toxin-antitoxin system death-on-curing family toxin [Rhodospirillaceae bacterium]|nr:type II toxin-antitoxin system death-on-curing family toxin [Rhodospirillaceae bacterium]
MTRKLIQVLKWLTEETVLAIHDAQLAEHGVGEGVSDLGLLQSALARPLNLIAYGSPDTANLAAAYAFGIAKNRPFVDGNKRTAFVVAESFIKLNGYALLANDIDCVVVMLRLAEGAIGEQELAKWFRDNISPTTLSGLHEEAAAFIPATKPRRRKRRARS